MLHRSTAFTITALVTGALLAPQPAPATAAGETCQGRPATIVGTGPDVVGTPGDDVIVSGSSFVVNAGAGNDLICTRAAGVRTDAGAGDDIVDASPTTPVDLETERETFTDLGTGRDRFLGTPFTDTVWSNGVDDVVSTGPGGDFVGITITDKPTGFLGSYDGGDRTLNTIYVRSAAFDLEVEFDRSIVVDGIRAATVTGFRDAEVVAPRVVLRGNASANDFSANGCDIKMDGKGGKDLVDVVSVTFLEPKLPCALADRTVSLAGGGGDDVVVGGPGDVRLSGGGGNDRLVAFEGADRLIGGAGNDRLEGGEGNDRLVGGAGIDRLEGIEGNDRLVGGAGRDRLDAGKGADRLVGGSGNDQLLGEKGADRLVGGTGRDRAVGGQGRDSCDAEIERGCEL